MANGFWESESVSSGSSSGTGTGVDPNDIGFDIILLAGQSNMSGRGASDAAVDIADSRVFQWDATNSKIISASASLLHYEFPTNDTKIGPGLWIGRSYAAGSPPNRPVLLVPAASGGTSIVAGASVTWNAGSPGGTNYEAAITRANNAITAAVALYPNSRFVGVIWHQGESDADNSVSQTNYTNALTAVIAGFRARITGASSSWFVIGGMCPEVITAGSANYTPIDLAHKAVAAAVTKCYFVAGPTGQKLDAWHYTAAGARQLGTKLGIKAAQVNAPVAATAITFTGPSSGVVSTASTNFTVAANGTLSANNTVTPSDGGAGGTFTPATVTLTSSATSATFTYTPASTGNKTLSVTNSGGLTNPSNITYAVSAAPTVPDAPTIGTATAGDASASVAFTPPGNNGGAAITGYTATSTPGGLTGTGASSPITVSGLSNGTAYTFTVHATNSVGNSAESAASNSVTPAAASAGVLWNPSDKNASFTLTSGNTVATQSGAAWTAVRGDVGLDASGDHQFEITVAGGSSSIIGIGKAAAALTNFVGNDANGYAYRDTGLKYNNNSSGAVGSGFVSTNVVGFRLHAGTLDVYVQGVLQGTLYTGLTGVFYPMASSNTAGVNFTINSGHTAFAYPIAGSNPWQ